MRFVAEAVAVGREAVRHLPTEHAAVAEPHQVFAGDRLAGEQARQDQVEDRLVGEHLAGGQPEQWHVAHVGDPEQAAGVDRHAVLDDPRVNLLQGPEQRLQPVLEEANIKDLWMSLVSNVDASPIGTAHAVRNALLRQVASPVRWVESVQKMISMGVRRFVEVGPGNVLTGLIKRIDASVELVNVSDVASIEAYVEKNRA